ncbi:helicase [Mycobacterium sp. 21AC1]|nr:helicase [Mycobacterium sp. 21AC1]
MLAAAMVAVLVVSTVAGGYLGAAVVARHRAQAAADLAALAAAGMVGAGAEAACARATMIATAMRVAVAACRVEGLDVVVDMDAVANLGRFGVGPARAVARAGPVQRG